VRSKLQNINENSYFESENHRWSGEQRELTIKHVGSDRIKEFLKEDMGYGDITSKILIDENQKAKGCLFFKEGGTTAGLEEAKTIFEILGCNVKLIVIDGVRVHAGKILMEINGPAQALLSGERTALNIVGRMSGIATTVAHAKTIISKVNPSVRIAGTRKTAPGLRIFDKKAIECGGGDPHRYRLDDCVLIKDNHLELVQSISKAVSRARDKVSFTKKIEVEVRTLEQAVEASESGADIVMFDNMSPEEICHCLSSLREKGLRDGCLFEASGGITLDNLAEYAASGVDIISMGSLTHSVSNLDVKLEIEMA
jgi:nicotinate-nucleotide pyrophosphorylase (carboxylating)